MLMRWILVLSVFFSLVSSVAAQSIEQHMPPASNTYVPLSGTPVYNHLTRVGAACQGNGIYTTPGIGPAPSAGIRFLCVELADSTAGNFSADFVVAYNSGGRYTAAMTGIAVLRPGTVAGDAWGGQFSAIAQGNAGGILQGANIESDWASGSVNGIGITVKLGSSDGSTNYSPGNSYLNLLADPGRAPTAGLRFQSGSLDPSAAVIEVEGPHPGCLYKVNGSCITSSAGAPTVTKTVRNAAGTGTCTMIYTLGLLTGGTC